MPLHEKFQSPSEIARFQKLGSHRKCRGHLEKYGVWLNRFTKLGQSIEETL